MTMFLGIGDLHLSSVNGGHGGFSRYVDNSDAYIMSEVRRVMEDNLDCSHVILYGDICDSVRMSYTAHEELHKFFAEYADRTFHVILGNHDKFAAESKIGHSLQLLELFHLPNVHIYEETKVVKFTDCKVNFLSYPHAEFRYGMLNVCHLDINGARMQGGRTITNKTDPRKYYIVSGHIHDSSHFRNVWYSGTLYQLNFGESYKRKGYHRIECIGKDIHVTYVPFLPKYELCTVTAESSADLKDLPAKNKFYRLLLKSKAEISPADYAHLNVVQVKSYESAAEIKMLEELNLDFEELNLDYNSVLHSILNTQYADDKERILSVRQAVLNSNG